jgi:hypothetical protein
MTPDQYGDPMFAGAIPVGASQTPAAATSGAPSTLAAVMQDGGGAYPLASVTGEGLMAPWTTAFAAPTPGEASQSPGFQFRLDEAMKAISRGSAANGTFLSGRTGKEMTRYAQDYASSEYDKVYNRKLGEYRQAYDIFNNNQTNQFNRLSSLAGNGQQAATNLGSAGASYANAGSDLITGAGNARAAGTVGAANAWGGAMSNIAGGVQDVYMADVFRPRA